MDYTLLLLKYFKNAIRSCENTYESIEWKDKTIVKPTKEELDLLYDNFIVDEMREDRTKLLKESDFRVVSDYPGRHKWIIYRQLLRHFPSIWTLGMEFPERPN
jgi:hypothetical protein